MQGNIIVVNSVDSSNLGTSSTAQRVRMCVCLLNVSACIIIA